MRLRSWILVVGMMVAGLFAAGQAGAQAAGKDAVLTPAEVGKIMPASVWFKGLSATTQLRNSGGVKFADGLYVLATLVDTSGYSSDVQQKYQAYFIAETPVKIEGHDLPAGIYGIGFVGDNKFLVLDVGAHDLFTVDSKTDAELKRPTPMRMTAGPDGFRLYAGRRFVTIAR